MTRAERTNTLSNSGTGAITLGVKRDFGVVTDYFPVCDSPNGVSGGWGYRYDPNRPRIVYTWYDNYLWKRYEAMRRAEREATGEEATRIWRYAIDFFDRYLRHRKYHYTDGTYE